MKSKQLDKWRMLFFSKGSRKAMLTSKAFRDTSWANASRSGITRRAKLAQEYHMNKRQERKPVIFWRPSPLIRLVKKGN